MPHITLELDPDNAYDSNAIKFLAGGNLIGYVPRSDTEDVHQFLALTITKDIVVEIVDARYNDSEELTWFTVNLFAND